MTDKNEEAKNSQEQINATEVPVVIHAQYLKDFSFENPNSPETFRMADSSTPQMDMTIDMNARKLEDDEIQNLYEVALVINATAKKSNTTLFMAELVYCATVSINNVEEKHHHPLLLIEVPKMIFPFARQILADATQNGGYPPLMLNPIDFHALYLSRFAKKDDEDNKKSGENKAA